jgi:hypothetical protein
MATAAVGIVYQALWLSEQVRQQPGADTPRDADANAKTDQDQPKGQA